MEILDTDHVEMFVGDAQQHEPNRRHLAADDGHCLVSHQSPYGETVATGDNLAAASRTSFPLVHQDD